MGGRRPRKKERKKTDNPREEWKRHAAPARATFKQQVLLKISLSLDFLHFSPLRDAETKGVSQEVVENDLQTDPENHLHPAPPQHPYYHTLPPPR